MTATMRAAMLLGQRRVEIVDLPVPRPGPGEVVVRVESALTDGTDAKVYRRGYHARMLTPPCLFGHEWSGVVAELGEGVADWSVGDAVVGGNSAPCGACRFCEEGRPALCDDLLFVNGAFAEYLLLPERLVRRNLHRRPEGLSPDHAAAAEPLACVLKGVDTAMPQVGESALLLGSGPIALFFVAALRAEGVRPVVYARSAAAETVALAMGADRVVVAPDVASAADALRAATPGGLGYDLVVEAAGAAETTAAAPALCGKGGRVLLFGGCAADVRVEVDPARLHYEEIALLASFHHTPAHVRAALDALAGGAVDPSPLMEPPQPLARLPDVLEAMCRREIRGKVPIRTV